jgi:flagellar biosynthesis protein FlhA
MPGKQMAIDADLNAGLINQEEARVRRETVEQEADFYGAMDGASKFVRGDAVAGILILIINIVGGLSVGTLQHGLSFSEAVQYYTLLTIGDGLVAQIPSLLLSTAAAIIVTRVSSAQDMGKQILTQLFSSSRALAVTAIIIGLLGIIPGMPNVAFLLLAAAAGGAAYLLERKNRAAAAVEIGPQEPEQPTSPAELTWDDVPPVDIIGLELGYRLIPLVDTNQSGELMARIKGVRRKLSQELGFLVHAVHIRDNLDLSPNQYRISLLGVPVGEGEVHVDRELAINPGQVFGTLQGIQTKDPAFGLDAVWIGSDQREQAQTMGYTVVDVSTVIATHLSALIQEHAHELLGHEEVQQLLNVLSRQAPKLVEDLVPKALPLSVVVKVLQNLLEERVPIRDMRTIAETLAEHGAQSQDPVELSNAARVALGRSIVQHINGLDPEFQVMTLSQDLEQLLLQSLRGGEGGGMGLEPGLAQRLHASLKEAVDKREVEGRPSVLVVSPQLRPWLARWLRASLKALHVLGVNEIPDNKQIRVVATVGQ